jgi:beta-hydroxylase
VKEPAQTIESVVRWNKHLIERYCDDADRAFLPPEQFPWIREVEARFGEIRTELDALLSRVDQIPAFHQVSSRQDDIADARWKTFFFKVYGHDVPESRALCPRTADALARIPRMSTAMFSILQPGKHIAAHHGPHKGVLRYHLGLRVPTTDGRCAIRVGEETRVWEEGKSLVFDDTFEHEAWNRSDAPRVVLFVDFLRPMPLPLEVANRALMAVASRFQPDILEARDNALRYARQLAS